MKNQKESWTHSRKNKQKIETHTYTCHKTLNNMMQNINITHKSINNNTQSLGIRIGGKAYLQNIVSLRMLGSDLKIFADVLQNFSLISPTPHFLEQNLEN